MKADDKVYKIEAIDLIMCALNDLFPHQRPGRRQAVMNRIGRSEEEELQLVKI